MITPPLSSNLPTVIHSRASTFMSFILLGSLLHCLQLASIPNEKSQNPLSNTIINRIIFKIVGLICSSDIA
ncbi:pentatricopeptide repeat-containing protein [Iris pallida]|uniref:Pentatricopeptide repeat-containing protein n=1 Tax=Iris pallida TaxID=29817 RepID=A0AAX6FLV3_IRIPA|nr:pentatricopeptide repeat-containing protein [Iris pallida]